ncbi:DUF397 domain-containing protein [Streptomyces sp. NPDC127119]
MSPDLPWQKPSFSGSGEDKDCLEISTTPTALNALLAAVKRR